MSVLTEFSDPRLVAIYDSVNAYGPGEQPDFYRGLAIEVGAATVLDVGCGTGLVTCDLAARGFQMTGIDPSPAMIDVARHRPFGDRVEWIVGEVAQVGAVEADLAFMSGHVAQFFVTDNSWAAALAAMRSVGRVAFESRNPRVREWEQWNVRRTFGDIETWTDVLDVRDDVVTFENHYLFRTTGEDVVAPAQLRFRSRDELTETLAAAGFSVEQVYGDWDRRPAGPATRELIIVATR